MIPKMLQSNNKIQTF